jgi:endonuclease IV
MLGSHVSINEIDKCTEQCPYQVFIYNPRSSKLCKNIRADMFNGKCVYVHSPYILNVCKETSLSVITQCTVDSALCGARGTVLHVGKSVDIPVDIANALQGRYLDHIVGHLSTLTLNSVYPPKLLLETPAGQGTELLTDIDDYLRFMIPRLSVNFGICVDTCHVWSTGYCPLEYIRRVYQCGGTVDLVHYNGSAKARGSRVDRHAHYLSPESTIPVSIMDGVLEYCREMKIDCLIE